MRSNFVAACATCCAVAWLAVGDVHAAPRDEIRGAFSKFVAAQNAHDAKAVGNSLDDSAEFLWLTPGTVIRGRDATLARFRELFKGAWHIDPDWPTFRIVMLDVSTAEIFVDVSSTGGGTPRATRMNQILVNTAHGWRVLTIVEADLPRN
jgi:ketosteroid isomerase-like protein